MVQGNAVQQSVTRGNRSSKLAMIKHIKTQLSNSDSPGIRGLRTKLRWKGGVGWGGVRWGRSGSRDFSSSFSSFNEWCSCARK